MGRGRGATMVNVRMPDELIAQIDEVADSDHLKRSSWCRELIVAAVTSGIGLEEIATRLSEAPDVDRPDPPVVEPKHPTGLGSRRVLTGQCLHPVHLMRRFPTQDVCTSCDTVVRRR